MCCDPRRSVRQTAIAYLQRALLAHTLHSLTEHDWEACFLEVRENHLFKTTTCTCVYYDYMYMQCSHQYFQKKDVIIH